MPADSFQEPRTVQRSLTHAVVLPTPWRDPVDALAPFADEAYAGLLLSGADGWSYLLRRPDIVDPDATPERAPELLAGAGDAEGPPFVGGLVGLASYELGARLEPSTRQDRHPDWPNLILARYPALVAFDTARRAAFAIGRGETPDDARAAARDVQAWLQAPVPSTRASGALAAQVVIGRPAAAHAEAVARTVERIAAGELFQANLARPWRGRLAAGATPFDLFRRLAARSPAPYAAYLRLPGRAVVSNSPERFLAVAREADGLWAESRPIKGTRPRGADPVSDAANAAELRASEKDRAENLMIVDLMRNDLSRVCRPGTVTAPELMALRSYANVHHLVSTVRGRLMAGKTAWDSLLAAFPPGSVTGAPKVQAMKVIADYEPPRGPYCGALFWAGFDGALDASVLIRTVAMVEDQSGWRFETRAGGGIVADSDPHEEVAETEAKIGAILRALTEASC